MFNLKKYLLASALTAMSASQAHAEFVLDSFDSYNAVVEITSSSSAVSTSRIITTTGVSVDFTVEAASAYITIDNSLYPTSPTQNGQLSYSASNTAGSLTLKYYDADITTGGFATSVNNTIDFTQLGDNFFFELSDAVDGSFDINVTASYWDGFAYATDTTNFTVADGQSGTILLGFNNFAFADFTEIESLTAFISTTNNNADFDLDAVGIVPEPASIALLGLGLLSIGLKSRKKSV
jgi:hypothetical protein